jgi:two-component system heavy metal sensor histidine kinase CusS
MSGAAWRVRLAETSLALRIALASVLFGLVVSALAAGFGYSILSHQLEGRVANELAGREDLLLHVLSEMATPGDIPANGHRFADLLIGHNDLHLAVLDPRDGRVLASFSRLALESVARLANASTSVVVRWHGSDGKQYASLVSTGTLGDGQSVRFVLSLDLQADRELLGAFVRATLVGLPVMLLLVALGSWTVARTGLAPLKRFTRLASTIGSNNLTQRLSRPGLPVELRELADDFDAMLERIDEGVTRLSEFSGDLAHEMRTPVATLLGRTQVALSKSRTIDELRDVLAGNVEELDRLTRLIADMLFLARADQGGAVAQRVAVDLAGEARRVAEFVSIVAEDRGIGIEVRGDATVQADRILVQRAITNLLTNAIRHADAPGVVSVTIRQEDGKAIVDVTNRGKGIAASQIDRVFERFVRLDSSRARSDGGMGLGLAIVKSIMQAHGGTVHASSPAGGPTTFRLVFAAAAIRTPS